MKNEVPPLTILAVEDDEVQTLLYTHVLNRPDWRVVVAPTLAQATRALDEHRISLVLLDLFLPDGDGRRWLGQLRARRDHASTPVIVVAGSAVMEAQVDCYELGADTMIQKPIAPQVLLAAVSGALRKGHPSALDPRPTNTPPSAFGSRQTTAGPPRAESREPRAVLFAEDDEVVAALVQHRLKREGFEVHRAIDGVAALEIAQKTPVSLAILDVMMPGLDGFELLTRLRQLPATARIPILMLTGLGGERDVERALSLGANDYVLKPFSPVELTARVNRLLRSG
jgi:DNA-binding response OmpR family regulator